MKFQIGYQNNRKFIQYLLAHTEDISELYFPWGDFTTGRGVMEGEEAQCVLENDLEEFARAGIGFCLLLNGNCYGGKALSRAFFDHLSKAVGELAKRFGLKCVTTASPVIASFLKKEFPSLSTRASVNMEIGTVEGIEYLLDHFDSFYLKREYNYDPDRILRLRECCRKHGKKLYILANSGCLNYCSARTFHDNLVAHQHEMAKEENAFVFHGLCSEFLRSGTNRNHILEKSNFIRPEDVHFYEELCDGMKLATRTNFNPMAVAYAYFNGRHNGNLLDLTEPAHSALLPGEILSTRHFPADYAQHRFHCDRICEKCNYCSLVQKNATIIL